MPRPEFLLDYEAGWRFTKNKFHMEVNAYFMDYFDQLVLTGELSDVGFALRRNVGRSYRTGIEIHGGYLISKKWKLEANAAFSRNRNIDWQEVLFDEDFNEVLVSFGNTNTAFSPNFVAGSVLSYEPISGLTLAWSNRFVGKQYLTNTNIEELTLPSYWIHDLRFRYQVTEKWRISLFVNNIFGNDLFFDWLSAPYASNGYGWSELRNGQPTVHNIGLYPQATTNFLLGVSLNL
jgi:iron complex outermembrane receptor protein